MSGASIACRFMKLFINLTAPRRHLFAAGLAAFLFVPTLAMAQTVTHVNDETSLRAALALAQEGDRIVLDNDIVLAAGDLPLTAGRFSLQGRDFTLQVADQTRPLVKSGDGVLVLDASSTALADNLMVTAGTVGLKRDILGVNATVALTDGTTLSFVAEDTSTDTITLAGFANLNVPTDLTVTQSGVITDGADPGTLVLNGGGTLILTNHNNSYSGGTVVIEDSTLVVDADDELGAGDVTLGDDTSGGTLRFADSFTSKRNLTLNAGGGTLDTNGNDATWAGAISGDGGLTKIGDGTLTVIGDLPLSGLTEVAEGALVFHGAIGGSVMVDEDGKLAGAGSIDGDLDVSGTIAPDARGTIKIGGDVTLEEDSTYQVLVGADGRATTLLQAAGAASIDGSIVDVSISSLPPKRVTQSLVLSAAGGIEGEATTQTANPAVDPYVTIGGTDDNLLVLTLVRNDVPLSGFATSANGRAAGSVIDRLRRTAADDLFVVTRELSALDDASLGDALDSVAGEIHASLPQLGALDSEAASDLIDQEIAARRLIRAEVQGNRAGGPWGAAQRLWIQLNGQHATFDGAGSVHGGTANLGGLATGVDRAVGGGWLVGGGGGYGTGRLTLVGQDASSQMTALRAFGYVGYASGRWAVHAGGGLAWDMFDTTRRLDFTARLLPEFGGQPIFGGVHRDAASNARGLTPDIWGNWQFAAGADEWRVRPAVGLRYARYGRNAWSETGAHALSLAAASQSLTSTQGTVGMNVERAGDHRIRPFGLVKYRRELTDGRATETLQLSANPANTFVVEGLELARDSIIGGLGFVVASVDASVSFGYQARHASGQTRHTFNVVVGF